MQNLFRLVQRQPKALPKAFYITRPSLLSTRYYSAAPEPLTVPQIEDRVMKVLQEFSKVDSSKVFNPF